jgi:potassium uptake TrkH family protein
MNWMEKFESLRIWAYDTRKGIFVFLDALTWIVFLAGFGLMIYIHGFEQEENSVRGLLRIFWFMMYFLIFRYLISFLFSLSPKDFFRLRKMESIIVLYLLAEVLSLLFWNSRLLEGGLFSFSALYYLYWVQGLFVAIVVSTVAHSSFVLRKVKLNPAGLLATSFALLIALGTVLLKLPEMTHNGSISWVNALFTATSASCVTGLTVLDTGTFFSLKGQLVIMVLFTAGGLNMLTIASFIGSLYHRTGSLHATGLIKGFLDTDHTGNLRVILKNVIIYALVIQLAGILLVYISWGSAMEFSGIKERLYFSVFHTLSAFNNAGFSLFSDSLYHLPVRHQYFLHLVIAALIVVGGLGFLVLQDVFARENRLQRKRYPWKTLHVNTRLVLHVTVWLILVGSVFFFILEYNHVLKDYSLTGKIVASFFQSVTTRTAGFNTVDTALLSNPSILLFLLFMFIGASPGSTGGGIKTTTFAVALQAASSNLRGKEHVEFFKRNIPWAYVNKTYAVLFSAFLLLVVFSLALAISEPHYSLKSIVFEVVSAFGTVGLSLGITPDLSPLGKMIVVMAMFVGRIGSLTLGIALTRRVLYTRYRYPDGRLMIG